jgi:acyl-CoA synthetase (AMP-forming)/AMP-acid ligase II/aryl carrier-like protein
MNTRQQPFGSLADLLEHYGSSVPERAAILAPGRMPLSYGALWQRTTEIVADLRRFGIGAKDRVAVVLPADADAAVATVAVASGATCVPLHAGFSADEAGRAFRDLQITALVTQPGVETASRGAAYSIGAPVIDLSSDAEDAIGGFSLACSVRRPAAAGGLPTPSDDAFILLTSGSTAQPKLVPLTQAGVCHSAFNAGVSLRLTPQDRLINVLPLVHAHGLISGLLTALAAGSSVVCPSAFEATAFLDWLTSFQATWYTAVPTIHRALIVAARRRKGNLAPALRLIRSASASLPTEVLNELESLFGVPVIETYGMTEAASQIAANPIERRKPGSVGKSAGAEIAVVDSDGRPLAADEPGEVVLRGPAITRGYYRNDEATRAAFRDGWFRTGDRGYLDSDGYLFLLGRINKVDIINRGGQKVSPAEVEKTLLSHPDVAAAAVFPIPHTRLGEDVAAAIVPRSKKRIEARNLRRFAGERLARFKVPGLIRIVPAIPTGPDGTVIRSELAARFSLTTPTSRLHLDESLTPPRSELEWQLATIWAELLGLNEVGVNEDVFALGADSLTIAQLLARLRSRFGTDLSFRDIFDAPTVESMAALLQSSKSRSDATDFPPNPAPDTRTPLSLQQQRLHFLSKFDPIPHKHYVMAALRLSGPLDVGALEASIATISERHDILRSIFPEHLGEPTQIVTDIRPRLEIELRLPPSNGASDTQASELLKQPFDVQSAPPIRVQLLRYGEHDHLLLIKQHHLITDGWSHRLFFDELEELYNAKVRGLTPNLPQIPIQYRHYVEWQKNWLETPAAEEQLNYWRRQLEGLTELPLRTDRPRPETWTGMGSRLPLKLSLALSNKIRALSRDSDATLFMTLLAAFQCLLCRYTQHHDVAVGSLAGAARCRY